MHARDAVCAREAFPVPGGVGCSAYNRKRWLSEEIPWSEIIEEIETDEAYERRKSENKPLE
jgi:hypothetical protein